MSYINSRTIDKDSRVWQFCRTHNRKAAEAVEDAEIRKIGETWFRPAAFGNVLADWPTEKPKGRGQILKL